jgi:hypothetical protein
VALIINNLQSYINNIKIIIAEISVKYVLDSLTIRINSLRYLLVRYENIFNIPERIYLYFERVGDILSDGQFCIKSVS